MPSQDVFIDTIPSPTATAVEVQRWLALWFNDRQVMGCEPDAPASLPSPDLPKRVQQGDRTLKILLENCTWTGVSIRIHTAIILFNHLTHWGMPDFVADKLAWDIVLSVREEKRRNARDEIAAQSQADKLLHPAPLMSDIIRYMQSGPYKKLKLSDDGGLPSSQEDGQTNMSVHSRDSLRPSSPVDSSPPTPQSDWGEKTPEIQLSVKSLEGEKPTASSFLTAATSHIDRKLDRKGTTLVPASKPSFTTPIKGNPGTRRVSVRRVVSESLTPASTRSAIAAPMKTERRVSENIFLQKLPAKSTPIVIHIIDDDEDEDELAPEGNEMVQQIQREIKQERKKETPKKDEEKPREKKEKKKKKKRSMEEVIDLMEHPKSTGKELLRPKKTKRPNKVAKAMVQQEQEVFKPLDPAYLAFLKDERKALKTTETFLKKHPSAMKILSCNGGIYKLKIEQDEDTPIITRSCLPAGNDDLFMVCESVYSSSDAESDLESVTEVVPVPVISSQKRKLRA